MSCVYSQTLSEVDIVMFLGLLTIECLVHKLIFEIFEISRHKHSLIIDLKTVYIFLLT